MRRVYDRVIEVVLWVSGCVVCGLLGNVVGGSVVHFFFFF